MIENKHLIDTIRQTAYEIHNYLGVGFLEKVYENALAHRLSRIGITVEQQVPIQVHDKDGFQIGDYIADLVVENAVIVELKHVEKLAKIHSAQLLNYLRATGIQHGMLINFGSNNFESKKLVQSQTSVPTPLGKPTLPLCPKCGKQMNRRMSSSGKPFWGCSGFPHCRTTLSI